MEEATFICTDCETTVFWFGPYDGEPRCRVCRFIRAHPEMPEHIKAYLRDDEGARLGPER